MNKIELTEEELEIEILKIYEKQKKDFETFIKFDPMPLLPRVLISLHNIKQSDIKSEHITNTN